MTRHGCHRTPGIQRDAARHEDQRFLRELAEVIVRLEENRKLASERTIRRVEALPGRVYRREGVSRG